MPNSEQAIQLITLGGLFMLGLAGEALGRYTKLPRVTLLLGLGILVGPSGLDLVNSLNSDWFGYISTVALVMIGFLLGGKMASFSSTDTAKAALRYSLIITLVTFTTVFLGLLLLGFSPLISIVLAGIALATDPAATMDVILELKDDSPFSNILSGIVALDDVWGLMLFTIVLVLATGFNQSSNTDIVMDGLWELLGAIMLGVGLGLPMAYLSGRVRAGEATTIEALAIVFLCSGLALYLHVSYILTAIILGFTVAKLAKHHKNSFHEIEHLEWPFLLLFFIMVGASLEVSSLLAIGFLGSNYILFRVLGRVLGAQLLNNHTIIKPQCRKWLGLSLLPQAGVAIGLALYASQRFPEIKDLILPITISATVIFELIGPVLTRKGIMYNSKC